MQAGERGAGDGLGGEVGGEGGGVDIKGGEADSADGYAVALVQAAGDGGGGDGEARGSGSGLEGGYFAGRLDDACETVVDGNKLFFFLLFEGGLQWFYPLICQLLCL